MNRIFNDHHNAQTDAAKRLLLIRHNLRNGEGLKATTFQIEQNLNHQLFLNLLFLLSNSKIHRFHYFHLNLHLNLM